MNYLKKFKKKIEKHWENAKLETPNLWNGELMCVSECKIDEKEIIITCQKTDYAHYLYDERIGLPKEFACSSLVAGCLIETSDNYYIVGELAENTSFPYCMQISGGSADADDINDGEINIFKTIIRECENEYLKYLKDNNLEIEFGKIHFIKKANVKEELDLFTNPKREYLKGLLEIDSKI